LLRDPEKESVVFKQSRELHAIMGKAFNISLAIFAASG
jgi:hypothetical protein